MTIYIQNVDVKADKIIVSGQVSATNISVYLAPVIYIDKPQDCIYGFELEEVISGDFGGAMMVPFVIEADSIHKDMKGAEIYSRSFVDVGSIRYLKAAKVKSLTEATKNYTVIESAYFNPNSDDLVLRVSYGGGCFEHSFSLEWDGTIMKSNPPIAPLRLVDTSDERDPCKAIRTKDLYFDLSSLDGLTAEIYLSTLSGSGTFVKSK